MSKHIYQKIDSKTYRNHDFRCDNNILLDISSNITTLETLKKERTELLKCQNKKDTDIVKKKNTEIKHEISKFLNNLQTLFLEQKEKYLQRLCAITQQMSNINSYCLDLVVLLNDFIVMSHVLHTVIELIKTPVEKNGRTRNDFETLENSDGEDIDCCDNSPKDICNDLLRCIHVSTLDLTHKNLTKIQEIQTRYNYIQNRLKNITEQIQDHNAILHVIKDDEEIEMIPSALFNREMDYGDYKHILQTALDVDSTHKVYERFKDHFQNNVVMTDSKNMFTNSKILNCYLLAFKEYEKISHRTYSMFIGLLKIKKYLQSIVFCSAIAFELQHEKPPKGFVFGVYVECNDFNDLSHRAFLLRRATLHSVDPDAKDKPAQQKMLLEYMLEFLKFVKNPEKKQLDEIADHVPKLRRSLGLTDTEISIKETRYIRRCAKVTVNEDGTLNIEPLDDEIPSASFYSKCIHKVNDLKQETIKELLDTLTLRGKLNKILCDEYEV